MTHPTLAIPELMRICLDDCGYSWDDAWKIVTQTFAYTNHTVMKEALECWPEDIFLSLLPRIYQIVKEIDNRYRAFIWDVTHDADKVEEMAIVSNGIIRMANLCVATCHSVNGFPLFTVSFLKPPCSATFTSSHRRNSLTSQTVSLTDVGFVSQTHALRIISPGLSDQTLYMTAWSLKSLKHSRMILLF